MSEKKSLREAYGKTLVSLGKDDSRIVVFEADLSKSTFGCLFGEAYPQRYFEMGIAEANMVSAAAGISLMGKTPFIASFAVFTTGRCYDQLRTSVCLPNLNVKVCGSSAGLSDYGDGSTHQSIDDITLMRVLPNMQVFSPCDAVQTEQVIRYMASHPGPMYIRINRNPLEVITSPGDAFVPGKLYVLREGTDAVLFATGALSAYGLAAAKQLAINGISLRVVNVPSIKPLDADELVALCHDVSAIVSAEEHSVIGGLGSAISEALASRLPKKVHYLGIPDCFGTSAENYDAIMHHYGLTPQGIIQTVRNSLA